MACGRAGAVGLCLASCIVENMAGRACVWVNETQLARRARTPPLDRTFSLSNLAATLPLTAVTSWNETVKLE